MRMDRAAVAVGALFAAVVAVAAIVGAQAVKALTGADASLPLYFVLLAGFVIGGTAAGRRQPQAPLTHGALAAIVGYLAVLVGIVVIRLALGRGMPDPVSFVFNGLMAASAGILGGYLAARGTALST
ncbi:MAG: hypothetical protein LC713_04925 [Actinobacteria bacterium]|nr:hypothetical protein [Actinomycetota bacterium]